MKPTVLLCFLSLQLLIANAIPVSVMLPLNTITSQGFNNPDFFSAAFNKLKAARVESVMVDVWWGLVENSGPKQYNWSAYEALFTTVQNSGLKLQAVMSFHQCGTNVGDACYVPLPNWVLQVGKSNPNIFYRDQNSQIDQEYLTLGIDHVPALEGRTGVQVYSDFMKSFAETFSGLMGSTINQIEVGMGPAGELRYPSYQLQFNRWSYCGIGAFQCYDSYMLGMLQEAADQAGQPSWGHGGPDDAGYYNSHPSDTGFFSPSNFDNYQSEYGQFFLNWYSSALLNHSDAILGAASTIFPVPISGKISGIHWWYADPSHAAEATAGYLNTDNNDAYLEIATRFAKFNATFDFTCLEMVDSDPGCDSRPQELVEQTRLAAEKAGIRYAGENALPICQSGGCDQSKWNQVIYQATQYGQDIERFTFLRLDNDLIYNSNEWDSFSNFVATMASR